MVHPRMEKKLMSHNLPLRGLHLKEFPFSSSQSQHTWELPEENLKRTHIPSIRNAKINKNSFEGSTYVQICLKEELTDVLQPLSSNCKDDQVFTACPFSRVHSCCRTINSTQGASGYAQKRSLCLLVGRETFLVGREYSSLPCFSPISLKKPREENST